MLESNNCHAPFIEQSQVPGSAMGGGVQVFIRQVSTDWSAQGSL